MMRWFLRSLCCKSKQQNCSCRDSRDPGLSRHEYSTDGNDLTDLLYQATARKGNVLPSTSSVPAEGTHTFKLRVTGTANSASGSSPNCPACVVVDRATIVQ